MPTTRSKRKAQAPDQENTKRKANVADAEPKCPRTVKKAKIGSEDLVEGLHPDSSVREVMMACQQILLEVCVICYTCVCACFFIYKLKLDPMVEKMNVECIQCTRLAFIFHSRKYFYIFSATLFIHVQDGEQQLKELIDGIDSKLHELDSKFKEEWGSPENSGLFIARTCCDGSSSTLKMKYADIFVL